MKPSMKVSAVPKLAARSRATKPAAMALVVCTLSALAPNACAGGDAIRVFWIGAQASSIPTLGGWSLALMALLLAVIGIRLLRSKGNGTRLMSVVLLLGATGLGSHSAHTIAGGGGVIVLDPECAAGDALYDGDVEPLPELQNQCPNVIEIVDYEIEDLGSFPGCYELVESCPQGTRVGPGGSCTLTYFDTSACSGR